MNDTLASSESPETQLLPLRAANQPLTEAFRIEPPRPRRSHNNGELWSFRSMQKFMI